MRKVNIVNHIKNLFANNAFLYRFYFLYFFKSIVGLIIPFLFAPLYSIGMLYLNGSELSSIILPALITNPLIFITFWFGSSFLMDAKKNSLAEKYFIFSKNSFSVNFVSFAFIFSIAFVSFFWNLLIIYFVSLDHGSFKNNILENISWGELIFSFIFTSILSTSICVLLSSTFKSIITLQIVSYILSIFLLVMSGSFVPISLIASRNVSNIISYFSIFRYTNGLFIESLNKVNLTNTNIFNLSTPYEIINVNPRSIPSSESVGRITIFYDYDQSLNLFISVFGSLGLFAFAMMLNRSKKRK